jgi:hypothetical protein
MTHKIWQAMNRKKAKGKLVRKKGRDFQEPVKVNKPKKLKRKQLHEKAHQNILGALKAKSPQVLDKVLKARDALPDGGGLEKDQQPRKGSSRAVLYAKNDHVAKVDGKVVSMKGIVKMAHDDHHDIKVGQDQNRVEASVAIQKHATLVRDKKGGFKTNKNGVVPPVFKHGNNHTFIHAGHAEDTSYDEIQHLTKTADHPNGLSLGQLDSASHPTRQSYRKSDPIYKHPLVKKLKKFRKETGVSDFHSGNIGVWTHPHTGEKHLVIRDAGFNQSVANKHYGHGGGAASQGEVKMTQATGSMGMRPARTGQDPGTARQGSLGMTQKQNWKHDAKAAKPDNTEKRYNAAMGDKRYHEAKAHYRANPPDTKEVDKARVDHIAGIAPREKWEAAHNVKVHNKVKGILLHKKTADINTADAHKVRAKYLAPIHGVPGESAGHETNNHAANLAADNRAKRPIKPQTNTSSSNNLPTKAKAQIALRRKRQLDNTF